MNRAEEILLKEMRYIASISNGQVKRVADSALASAREYLATEPSGERAELIANLRSQECCQVHGGTGSHHTRCKECPRNVVDMLEADGKQKETKNEQQVRSEVDAMGGRQPMEVSGDCSRDNFNGDDRALVASMVALLKLDAAGCLVPHGIGGYARKLLQASITRLEADAQQANKPTGWDNGLSQDYCAEFGKWLASRPGARQQIKEMFDEPEEGDLYALALKADNWGQP